MSDTRASELEEWERLARAATPGPWTPTDSGVVYHTTDRLAQVFGGSWPQQTANALFIAACSPERILALLAEARATERRLLHVAAHSASVTLDDALGEAQDDTARLDWLQEHAAHVEPLFSCDPEEPGWRVRSEESLDMGEGNTLREAIDLARRATPAEDGAAHD